MRIESEEKEECEVVSVPKSLEALVTDFVVGGGVHEEHDEEHKVAGDAASLGVVNVERGFYTGLCGGVSEGVKGGGGTYV